MTVNSSKSSAWTLTLLRFEIGRGVTGIAKCLTPKPFFTVFFSFLVVGLEVESQNSHPPEL